MKIMASFLLFLSLSTQAQTCFNLEGTVQTNEVKLAQEICFATPELELQYFDDSYVLLRYSIDGERAFKRAKLKGVFNSQGYYQVNIVIASQTAGSICDEYYEASSILQLEVSADGASVNLSKMTGEIGYTYDQCHDQVRTIQTLNYSKK